MQEEIFFQKIYVAYIKMEKHRKLSSQIPNYDNENISKTVELNPRIETIGNILKNITPYVMCSYQYSERFQVGFT